MSNVSLNFLANSFLLSERYEDIKNKTLPEIELELDAYRAFINSNSKALDAECVDNPDDSVLLSDSTKNRKKI
jgi:hypothetical protein